MKPAQLQLIIEAAAAAVKRINRPANLCEIAMEMRKNGFEFSRKLCINDLYVYARRISSLRKCGKDLYELAA